MEMVDLMEVGYETLWWEKEGGGKFDFKILMAKQVKSPINSYKIETVNLSRVGGWKRKNVCVYVWELCKQLLGTQQAGCAVTHMSMQGEKRRGLRTPPWETPGKSLSGQGER